MLNFGDTEKKFSIPDGLPAGVFTDVLGGGMADFAASPEFTIPSLGAAVFVEK